uniref:RING-type domain-containing protein n=1 Tax=Caenorhabditis tropicalis TaxID=1561998 RepID=A0A1I7TYR6_9PELO
MADVSMNDQIKLASEWGYNQEDIIAALKVNSKDGSKEFERFENFDVMLDILNKVSGRTGGDSRSKLLSVFRDLMSTSVTSLHPHSSSSKPHRSLSVARSSSFHLSTPKSTRDSHDIVRLLATLEKEKERDRKEVDSQFTILKNRINHLENEKEQLLAEVQDLKRSFEESEQDLKDCREEMNRLMEEKIEAADKLDKMTIQNYRQQQEIHDQKELSEHRKKIYSEEKTRKDEEILNLQKQKTDVEMELERKSLLLDEQTSVTKRLEEQSYQLKPLVLLDELSKKQSQLLEISTEFLPNINAMKALYNQLFDSFPQLEANVNESKLSMERRVEEIEEQLRSRNRDFQRLQEKLVAECCICLATKPSIVFMPCRHLITCSDCFDASDFRECPTCRSTIENSITVFI